MKRLLILVTVLGLALAAASPALAEHNAEHVQESTWNMQSAFMPPGVGDVMSLYGTDLSGSYRELFLLDLGGLCKLQGGYYYDSGDGSLYWHDCAGTSV